MSVAGQSKETALALAFASEAAEAGWSRSAFETFCARHHVGPDERRRFWPQGPRSVARCLNEAADEQMRRAWRDVSRASLADIVLRRFADNHGLKRSVANLARSDLLHPFDTLLRTSRTADQMLLCRGGYRGRGSAARFFERWSLAILYSLCVLIWIGDRTESQTPTKRATRAMLSIPGLA